MNGYLPPTMEMSGLMTHDSPRVFVLSVGRSWTRRPKVVVAAD